MQSWVRSFQTFPARTLVTISYVYITSFNKSLIQAPIKVFGIEGRYAHALYSAAVKSKQHDKVETELDKLKVKLLNS
jgi:hypothetical protein